MMGCGQTLLYCIIGIIKRLIRFSRSLPNFEGHHAIKIVKMSVVCTPERIRGFDQTCTETPLRHGEEMIRVC